MAVIGDEGKSAEIPWKAILRLAVNLQKRVVPMSYLPVNLMPRVGHIRWVVACSDRGRNAARIGCCWKRVCNKDCPSRILNGEPLRGRGYFVACVPTSAFFVRRSLRAKEENEVTLGETSGLLPATRQ